MKIFLLTLCTLAAYNFISAQDSCETAVDITNGGTFIIDEINGERPDLTCFPSQWQEAGEWYYYTNSSETDYKEVFVNTNLPVNEGVDPSVNVYEGSCGALDCVTGADNVDNFIDLFELTFYVPPMTTYYVVFDDRRDASGFEFQVSSSVADPDCTTSLPFYEDFKSVPDFDLCYTTEDLDESGYGWSQFNLDFENNGIYKYFAVNAGNFNENIRTDEYLISPAFNFEAGVEYTLMTRYNGIDQQIPSTEHLEAIVLDGPSSDANVVGTFFNTIVENTGQFFFLDLDAITNSSTFTPTTTGEYYVAFRAYTDQPGRNGLIYIFSYEVSSNAAVNDIKDKNNISFVYPNPVLNKVNINLSKQFNPDKTVVTVIDIKGKVVGKFNSVNHVNLQTLPKGVYILELNDGKHKETKKIIKE